MIPRTLSRDPTVRGKEEKERQKERETRSDPREKRKKAERGRRRRGEGKEKDKEKKRALCFPKKIFVGFDKLPMVVSFFMLGRLAIVTLQ